MTSSKHLNMFFEAIGIFACLMFSIFIIYILSFYEQTNKQLFLQLSEVQLLDWQRLFTIIFGAAGLILGFFFFKIKNSIDEKNSNSERARNLLEFIHAELMRADTIIENIFRKKIDDAAELSSLRHSLDKIYEGITFVIDCNDGLLKLSDDDVDSIISIHSQFTNNSILFKQEYSSFTSANTELERDEYNIALQAARTICIERVGNL